MTALNIWHGRDIIYKKVTNGKFRVINRVNEVIKSIYYTKKKGCAVEKISLVIKRISNTIKKIAFVVKKIWSIVQKFIFEV